MWLPLSSSGRRKARSAATAPLPSPAAGRASRQPPGSEPGAACPPRPRLAGRAPRASRVPSAGKGERSGCGRGSPPLYSWGARRALKALFSCPSPWAALGGRRGRAAGCTPAAGTAPARRPGRGGCRVGWVRLPRSPIKPGRCSGRALPARRSAGGLARVPAPPRPVA